MCYTKTWGRRKRIGYSNVFWGFFYVYNLTILHKINYNTCYTHMLQLNAVLSVMDQTVDRFIQRII